MDVDCENVPPVPVPLSVVSNGSGKEALLTETPLKAKSSVASAFSAKKKSPSKSSGKKQTTLFSCFSKASTGTTPKTTTPFKLLSLNTSATKRKSEGKSKSKRKSSKKKASKGSKKKRKSSKKKKKKTKKKDSTENGTIKMNDSIISVESTTLKSALTRESQLPSIVSSSEMHGQITSVASNSSGTLPTAMDVDIAADDCKQQSGCTVASDMEIVTLTTPSHPSTHSSDSVQQSAGCGSILKLGKLRLSTVRMDPLSLCFGSKSAFSTAKVVGNESVEEGDNGFKINATTNETSSVKKVSGTPEKSTASKPATVKKKRVPLPVPQKWKDLAQRYVVKIREVFNEALATEKTQFVHLEKRLLENEATESQLNALVQSVTESLTAEGHASFCFNLDFHLPLAAKLVHLRSEALSALTQFVREHVLQRVAAALKVHTTIGSDNVESVMKLVSETVIGEASVREWILKATERKNYGRKPRGNAAVLLEAAASHSLFADECAAISDASADTGAVAVDSVLFVWESRLPSHIPDEFAKEHTAFTKRWLQLRRQIQPYDAYLTKYDIICRKVVSPETVATQLKSCEQSLQLLLDKVVQAEAKQLQLETKKRIAAEKKQKKDEEKQKKDLEKQKQKERKLLLKRLQRNQELEERARVKADRDRVKAEAKAQREMQRQRERDAKQQLKSEKQRERESAEKEQTQKKEMQLKKQRAKMVAFFGLGTATSAAAKEDTADDLDVVMEVDGDASMLGSLPNSASPSAGICHSRSRSASSRSSPSQRKRSIWASFGVGSKRVRHSVAGVRVHRDVSAKVSVLALVGEDIGDLDFAAIRRQMIASFRRYRKEQLCRSVKLRSSVLPTVPMPLALLPSAVEAAAADGLRPFVESSVTEVDLSQTPAKGECLSPQNTVSSMLANMGVDSPQSVSSSSAVAAVTTVKDSCASFGVKHMQLRFRRFERDNRPHFCGIEFAQSNLVSFRNPFFHAIDCAEIDYDAEDSGVEWFDGDEGGGGELEPEDGEDLDACDDDEDNDDQSCLAEECDGLLATDDEDGDEWVERHRRLRAVGSSALFPYVPLRKRADAVDNPITVDIPDFDYFSNVAYFQPKDDAICGVAFNQKTDASSESSHKMDIDGDSVMDPKLTDECFSMPPTAISNPRVQKYKSLLESCAEYCVWFQLTETSASQSSSLPPALDASSHMCVGSAAFVGDVSMADASSLSSLPLAALVKVQSQKSATNASALQLVSSTASLTAAAASSSCLKATSVSVSTDALSALSHIAAVHNAVVPFEDAQNEYWQRAEKEKSEKAAAKKAAAAKTKSAAKTPKSDAEKGDKKKKKKKKEKRKRKKKRKKHKDGGGSNSDGEHGDGHKKKKKKRKHKKHKKKQKKLAVVTGADDAVVSERIVDPIAELMAADASTEMKKSTAKSDSKPLQPAITSFFKKPVKRKFGDLQAEELKCAESTVPLSESVASVASLSAKRRRVVPALVAANNESAADNLQVSAMALMGTSAVGSDGIAQKHRRVVPTLLLAADRHMDGSSIEAKEASVN